MRAVHLVSWLGLIDTDDNVLRDQLREAREKAVVLKGELFQQCIKSCQLDNAPPAAVNTRNLLGRQTAASMSIGQLMNALTSAFPDPNANESPLCSVERLMQLRRGA
jgi:ribosomal protein L10